MANVGLGLSLFSKEVSRFGDNTLLWVYVAFIVVTTAVHVVMIVASKLISKSKKNKEDFSVAMTNEEVKVMDSEDKDKDTEKPKEPAPHSFFLWLGLGVFGMATILTFLVLFVLLVLPLQAA